MGMIYRAVSQAIRDEVPVAIKSVWHDLTNKSFEDTKYLYTKEKLPSKWITKVNPSYATHISLGTVPTVAKYERGEIEQWRYCKIELKEHVNQAINPVTQEIIKEDRYEISRKVVAESDKPINPLSQ